MDGFKLYGDGARKFKTISSDETKKLFEENSKLARSKIFEGNLSLVAFVITNKFSKVIDKEELFQVGSLGLWEAILNFNVSFQNFMHNHSILYTSRKVCSQQGTDAAWHNSFLHVGH